MRLIYSLKSTIPKKLLISTDHRRGGYQDVAVNNISLYCIFVT
jgi:hypothetical protein